jgi:hypothetical protein
MSQEPPSAEKEKFSSDNFVVFIGGTCIAAPLCKSGLDSVLAGEYVKGAFAFCLGLSVAAAAFTFRFWKSGLNDESREFIRRISRRKQWVVPALIILSTYAYVVVPDFYSSAQRRLNPSNDSALILQLQSQITDRDKQISDLRAQFRNSNKSTATSPQPDSASTNAPVRKYELAEDDIAALADEFYKIKDGLPSTIDIQRLMYDGVSMGLSVQLSRAFDLGTLKPTLNWNRPLYPKDTGVAIRVGDTGRIPPPAKQIAEILNRVAGLESHFEAVESFGPEAFMIFVGPKPAN